MDTQIRYLSRPTAKGTSDILPHFFICYHILSHLSKGNVGSNDMYRVSVPMCPIYGWYSGKTPTHNASAEEEIVPGWQLDWDWGARGGGMGASHMGPLTVGLSQGHSSGTRLSTPPSVLPEPFNYHAGDKYFTRDCS